MRNIFNYSTELVQLIILLSLITLRFFDKIDNQFLFYFASIVVGTITIQHLAGKYIDFLKQVRGPDTGIAYPFVDNRAVNFLNFDLLKFILILIALISVIILGLNHILNNETIATLLGGLIGSLLTMKGSWTDLKIPGSLMSSENINS